MFKSALALLLLAAMTSTVFAGVPGVVPRKRAFEMPTPGEFAGSATHLPVNCHTTPEDLVAWARNMPDVLAAMNIFTSRGYIAYPASDTGHTECAHGAAGVTLAYSKPGAFIDSFHVALPMILISTHVNEFNEADTKISGGIFVADGQTGVAFSGDSLAMFRTTDHSFEIIPGSGSSIEQASPWYNPNSTFSSWVRCTGWGTVGCVGTALAFGGPGFTSMKLGVLSSQPELAAGLLGACALGSGIACIGGR